ncbi:MAG: OmpH family outer membrane protein [Bacteroidetes bacterium]|nr:OmpH family outer membrane protein [Bacteroidota bacterium]
MKKTISILAVAVVCIFSVKTTNAQAVKLGYVDTETILKQLPDALEADRKLKDIAIKYQDTLKKFEDDLKTRYEAYKKQEAMMTADAKKKEEDALKGIQQVFLQYQEEKFGQTGEIAHMRETFMTPIREKILATIKEVAKEEKISFVFDKTNPSLLYAEDKFEITYKVIDKIKRK